MNIQLTLRRRLRQLFPAMMLLASLAVAVMPGCDTKEKMFELDTPAVDVDVQRDKATGDVEVKVDGEE